MEPIIIHDRDGDHAEVEVIDTGVLLVAYRYGENDIALVFGHEQAYRARSNIAATPRPTGFGPPA